MNVCKWVIALSLLTTQTWATSFPSGPEASLTPGSLCESGRVRHPQGIIYCERNVSSRTKWEVFDDYNALGKGYDINTRNRHEYKIDHFYPLCIGGSNNKNNLWPQHETIYAQTDDIEHLTCEMVSQGKIKRQEALDLVIRAKTHLDEAAGILQNLQERAGKQIRH